MNQYELNALEALNQLTDNYGVIGIKNSFEDEGASLEEIFRVKQMCSQAGCELHLKIGGAEAIRDLRDAMTLEVTKAVAPMIESPFALEKFVNAYEKYVEPFISTPIQMGINVETTEAIKNLPALLANPKAKKLSGCTIGRCDLAFSMGLDRKSVDSKPFMDIVTQSLQQIKAAGFHTFMGGAISGTSIPVIEKLYFQNLLDCIETRYVIFKLPQAIQNLQEGLALAHQFEIHLLKSKKMFYQTKTAANEQRLDMITNRIDQNKERVNA